ncbi:MAG: hypothetical protein KGL39_56505 [Patescibacteria group bacterium]|nr:hypothetical protein [Patescibacteria group bacterium]
MSNPETTADEQRNLPEWALRHGWSIASRHIKPDESWDGCASLAGDIAEVLYNIAPPVCGSRNTTGLENG